MNQTVEIVCAKNNVKYYFNKGYGLKLIGEKFIVAITDLAENSLVKIDVKCDYCGKFFKRTYANRFEAERTIIHKDCCIECRALKVNETNQYKLHMGYEKVFQEFKEKDYVLISKSFHGAKDTLKFICNKHRDIGVQSVTYYGFQKRGFGCPHCKKEARREETHKRKYDNVKMEFEARNYQLISDKYHTVQDILQYICLKHADKWVQEIRYVKFQGGHGCVYCAHDRYSRENHHAWKGGITPINAHLREAIIPWILDSIKNSDKKCLLTGGKFDDVHHLYSFKLIVNEVFKITNLPIKTISDYTSDELKLLENTCLRLHYKYGYGVCLSRGVHKLYHAWAGRGKNTPKQFEEFKIRYLNGEFKNVI